MTVRYYPDVPAEIIEAVRPILDRWSHLAPAWCHDLRVCYSSESAGTTLCSIGISPEYRNAALTVYPAWLTEDPEKREAAIRHELIHIALEPTVAFVSDALKRLLPKDERLREWLRDKWRQAFEGSVCDLEAAFSRTAEGQAITATSNDGDRPPTSRTAPRIEVGRGSR